MEKTKQVGGEGSNCNTPATRGRGGAGAVITAEDGSGIPWTHANGGLEETQQERAPSPVWETYDLLALLTWDNGKLQGTAMFRTPEIDNRISCAGKVEGSEEGRELRLKCSLSLATRGYAGRAEYAVTARRDGDATAYVSVKRGGREL